MRTDSHGTEQKGRMGIGMIPAELPNSGNGSPEVLVNIVDFKFMRFVPFL